MLQYIIPPVEYLISKGQKIASFVKKNETNIHRATVKSFSKEWKKFNFFSDEELDKAGKQYFDIVGDNIINKQTLAMDIGCGSGRWTRFLSDKVKFIEAIDPSDSVYSAAELNADKKNVRVTKASIDNIPFVEESFDFIFCLGVIHHVPETEKALRAILKKLKKDGHFLLYIYYNLDNRNILYKLLYALSDVLRLIVSHLPSFFKLFVCDIISVLIYLPFIFIARAVKKIFRNNWYKRIPLSYYIGKSFRIIRNDTLDRFGTPLEKRFSKKEITEMLQNAGMTDIVFSNQEPYWHCVAKKSVDSDIIKEKNRRKKVLFIAKHRLGRAPGQRFRFEQYINYLNNNGFACRLSYLLNDYDDFIFYSKGKYLIKIWITLKTFYSRWRDIFKLNNYDIIFIFREAYFLGPIFFEYFYKNSKARIIFDYDDAIWLQDVSDANKKFSWLKMPEKTSSVIRISDMIFAGNKYLADYASMYNKNVKLIPTTIDTDYHKRKNDFRNNSRICIGWTGSITTIKHFEFGIPFLKKIKEKYGDKIYFKVIGDADYSNKELEIKGIGWNIENEIQELSEIDIGIMPLPDDNWSKGKCGFKALQYMALEIPCLVSPVGVNMEIVKDGVNGFLANSMEEWVEKFSLLIESKEIREKIGKAGRQTVMDRYSVESQKQNYVKYFNEVLDSHY